MGSAGSVPRVYDIEARGIVAMLIALSTGAIISRLISRSLQRAGISTDDYLVVLGYLFNLGLLISILLVVRYGGVNLPKMAKLSFEEALDLKNSTIALAFLYTFATITIKISVLFMYRRIFTLNEKWFRIAWWANFILIFPCYTVTSLTLIAWQVGNAQKFGANNISIYASFALGSVNAVSDVLVLTLPIITVWRLIMSVKEKVAISGIFLLGLMVTSISIMRVVRFRVKRDHHWNTAYSFYNDSMTSATETSVALICACLTVIKPLLRKTRDITTYSFSSLISWGSWGSRGRRSNGPKASRADSVRSDGASLHSRKHNRGIMKINQYDIETVPKPSRSEEVALQAMHPWVGK